MTTTSTRTEAATLARRWLDLCEEGDRDREAFRHGELGQRTIRAYEALCGCVREAGDRALAEALDRLDGDTNEVTAEKRRSAVEAFVATIT